MRHNACAVSFNRLAQMEGVRKKLSDISPVTMALGAIGVGVSFLMLRQLWRRIAKNTSSLVFSQLRLLEQINEARAASTSIVYLTIDETIRISGDIYRMDFNLMTKIEKKEQDKILESKNPFLPPFQPGLHICELGQGHRLLFNKYSIYQNHVLIVTKEFQPQENKLTEEDFKQCVLVQGALGGVFYFNSGPESGASQKHKHIQVLPAESRRLPFVQLIEEWLSEQQQNQKESSETLRHPKFSFLHGFRTIPDIKDEVALAHLYHAAYEELYKQVVKSPKISYNLIATERFILLVPRKKERAFEEVSINSVGFAGSILLKSRQQYTHFQTLKLESIIADISFSSEEELDHAIETLSAGEA